MKKTKRNWWGDLLASPMRASFTAKTVRDVNKRSGVIKERVVHRPNEDMVFIHRLIVERVNALATEAGVSWKHATAYRPKICILDDVACHRQSTLIYVTDVKNAFPSLSVERLAGVIAELEGEQTSEGFAQIVAALRRFCYYPGENGLVTGGAASNLLFNLYCAVRIDQPLAIALAAYTGQPVLGVTGESQPLVHPDLLDCLASTQLKNPLVSWLKAQQPDETRRSTLSHCLVYTRSGDDLKVSYPTTMPYKQWEEVRRLVRAAIEESGFSVNHPKSRNYDLRVDKVVLNGVGLEYGGRLYSPRHWCSMLRRRIDQLRKKSPVELTAKMVRQVDGLISNFVDVIRANVGYNGLGPNKTEKDLLAHCDLFRQELGWLIRRPN